MNVKFELNIESGNAAIAEDPEIAISELLRVVAKKTSQYGASLNLGRRVIRDVNGNRVGTFNFVLEEDQ